jgi:chorismate mutase
MGTSEPLAGLRERIDAIDGQIVQLFAERMAVVAAIAELKRQGQLPVADSNREQTVIQQACLLADPALAAEVAELMATLMALSRRYQTRLIGAEPTAEDGGVDQA